LFTKTLNFAPKFILLSVKSNKLKNSKSKFNRITVKVGSNVITLPDGSLNSWRMSRLVQEIAMLSKQGTEVVLVTSGAVAAGRGDVPHSKETNIIAEKQVLASIGQVKLMASYQFLFGKYGMQAGQVLASKESFRDRLHYLNMKNCITAMLENKVLPVVNENDAISINELMFTDNDELSGLISSLMDCQSLIILTNVDGIYNGEPESEGTELIKEIDKNTDDLHQFITDSKSGFGRGGMHTKYLTARRIASNGIDVYIANGNRDAIITDIVRGNDVPCTHLVANTRKKTGVKKWLSHSETFAKGAVIINKGAKEALLGAKASSLLMVGITGVEGFFKSGDIVRILDEQRNNIGLGKSQYDSEKTEENMGQKLSKPFIHYHYLIVNESN
jgi:glutamate 5-kinase